MSTCSDRAPAEMQRRKAHWLRLVIGVVGLLAGVALMSQPPPTHRLPGTAVTQSRPATGARELQAARADLPVVVPSAAGQGT